jgi:hypothetical protein
MPDRPHGLVEQRGLDNTPRQRSYDGRFGRMFQGLANQPAQDPDDPEHDRELRQIADSMLEQAGAGSDNERMPAGYVYLGQFIDHDITFDPTSQLQRRNDPDGLINFRTPRFDLDSVYGSGPFDEPFQYDDPDGPHGGFAFLIEDRGGPDLPRNSRDRALIGDPRNDENSILSQLHVAFLSLHNRRMDDLAASVPDPQERFSTAQRDAQWHYQWVVAHDFLRRVIGDQLHQHLLLDTQDPAGGQFESVRLRFYRHKTNPYLPVEFSSAAYRFGHSQVRDEYDINSRFHRRLFDPSRDDFRGFQPLRPGWHASWPFFFKLDGQTPQLSRTIDTSLAPTLTTLQGLSGDDANLPLRNLRRGAAIGLPSGQAVAIAMKIPPLPDSDLAPAPAGRAPLWFYVLREAQLLHAGQHLGPVGGRIVGETLLGLLRADPQSYLSLQPGWTPTLDSGGKMPRDFDMADLLRYAVPAQATRF